MPDLIQAVKDYALAHYNQGGWDILHECYSDQEIAELIKGAKTPKGAIRCAARTMNALGRYRSDIQGA